MSTDVTFIIVSYNCERYLKQCLTSCIEQLGSDLTFEIVFVDDGSTDNTWSILASEKFKKVQKYKIKNSGIEAASNFAFSHSSGRYFVRVDADDMLNPRFLQHLSKFLNEKADFYYFDYSVIDELGRLKKRMKLPKFNVEEISHRGDFLATGTVFSRNLIETIGGYNTSNKNCGLENYELILAAIQTGFVGFHISENAFFYRRHNNSLSIKQMKKIVTYGEIIAKRYNLEKYATNRYHPYSLEISE